MVKYVVRTGNVILLAYRLVQIIMHNKLHALSVRVLVVFLLLRDFSICQDDSKRRGKDLEPKANDHSTPFSTDMQHLYQNACGRHL